MLVSDSLPPSLTHSLTHSCLVTQNLLRLLLVLLMLMMRLVSSVELSHGKRVQDSQILQALSLIICNCCPWKLAMYMNAKYYSWVFLTRTSWLNLLMILTNLN